MIKKLATDGPIVMTIQSARQTEGNYGTQIEFVGMESGASEDTVLYISERSAARQLQRLSLSTETVAGETLRFEQVQKGDRSYNNIYRAESAAAPAPAAAPAQAPQRAAPGQPSAIVPAAMMGMYDECLAHAAQSVITMSDETGIEISGSDIVAAAATIFIQRCRR